MSALDTIAGVAVGGFLIAVAVNGNSHSLVEQASKDRGFLKWAVAVGILAYAYKLPEMSGPVTLIIAIAFLALFLQNGSKIVGEASRFWGSLNGAGVT
jgi:hypothetical protein